jgi:hypothetical protein
MTRHPLRLHRLLPGSFTAPGNARNCRWAAVAVAALWASLPAAAADIDSIVQFRNVLFNQTASDVSAAGAFFTTELVAKPGWGGGTFVRSFSGDTPTPLHADGNGTSHSMASSVFASQQAMDTVFPAGTDYSYAVSPLATPGSNLAEVTIEVPGDTYPDQVPQLTALSFSRLQGLNASQAISLGFNSFQPDPAASEAFTFFAVYDRTTYQRVFDLGFAPANIGGVTLAGGTLQPGHDYFFELIFDNRMAAPAWLGVTTFENRSNFELRTAGQFSTAPVPEPRAVLLMLLGLAGLGLARRRAA